MAVIGSRQVVDILREMHSDTFRNAAAMPTKVEDQIEWQGLGLQIGGVRLASPMGEISEIMQPPRCTSLPGMKPWLLGISNVRGRLIPIVDMHKFLDVPSTLPKKDWRVLVIEEGDLIVGLLIEQSLGMQHFVEEGFEDATPAELPNLQGNLRGAYRHSGRIYYVVSLLSLVRDERLFEIAEPNG